MISTSSMRRRVSPPGAFRYRIAETRVSPWMTWALVIANPSLLMMKPEPLPEGVSIEITASPYLLTRSLTPEGFKTPVV